MGKVERIYVEKRPGYDVEADSVRHDVETLLGIKGIKNLRILNRYDVEGVTEEEFDKARYTVFSEPPVDSVYDSDYEFPDDAKVFAYEYLPGQYDQRADSCAQCIQLLSEKKKPIVKTARVVLVTGDVFDADMERIKGHLVNPVDSRIAALNLPKTLELDLDIPESVEILEGFIDMDSEDRHAFMNNAGLAMNPEDLEFIQSYFKDTEKRNPTVTELRVIDTYWSDHCRHTTFLTEIEDIVIEKSKYTKTIEKALDEYTKARENIHAGRTDKPRCLMDMATIAMKEMRASGNLDDLEISDEINACSIIVDAVIDGKTEEWLVMFKNETHNHPTEIEPFGGAATCLGGAIRDPLSGRSYVYQAMRVTGSADPTVPVTGTLKGKLPQIKITREAAHGFSSYGNQIGLATGQVAEVYDEGFMAKRMEVGAVIAAAPRENVRRLDADPGDIIVLVGGRTGRDGCGGATGSSKEHTEESLAACGAEVQKGNPPTERKLQRLFRNPEASRLIKKCNDFGAGGVAVAIGELAPGLSIDLNAVLRKYEGLDGTELAISESQERMAVVLSPEDVDSFIHYADEENLECSGVAEVTDTGRLVMNWNGFGIVDISRDFLDTNGVTQKCKALISAPSMDTYRGYFDSSDLKKWMAGLSACSRKGLVERFDSTIGAGSILMPYGGKYQMSPQEGMAAKLPVRNGKTNTGTLMTYGYNPSIGSWSPFHGAVYAVVESVSKIAAMGGDIRNIRLTLQEYFEKLGENPGKWGKPASALLGAYHVQKELGIPAIGGKDSMSGTFRDMNVPPTLVSFAVCPVKTDDVISAEFKKEGSYVIIIYIPAGLDLMPDFDSMKSKYNEFRELVKNKKVLSAATVRSGGAAETVTLMSLGNRIGFRAGENLDKACKYSPGYGSILAEVTDPGDFTVIGRTTSDKKISLGDAEYTIEELQGAYEGTLEKVFPTKTDEKETESEKFEYMHKAPVYLKTKTARPKVVIPVFPGTNCEYDSERAFKNAGAVVETMIFRNLSPNDVRESVERLAGLIDDANIMMIPGGFSAGDEPEGSGKFIANVFRNPRLLESVMNLIKKRDGLVLGICNGFQALVKLGLLPYGEIRPVKEDSPTLTFNRIGRHVSCMTRTRISSVLSPWLSMSDLGDVHVVPVSHGEGRFVADEPHFRELIENGQIATRYVDFEGIPSMDIPFNPNGSMNAVEGITSPDGRVFGKMGHSERKGKGVCINIPGNKDQKIFESGVMYFR